MAKPRNPSRRGRPSDATPDSSGTYALPHHAGLGPFGSAPSGSPPFDPMPAVGKKHAPEPVRASVLPEAGLTGQPPSPNPAFVTGPVVVADRLTVVAGVGLSPEKQIAVVHLRNLIMAFEEVERYETSPQRATPGALG